MQTKRHEKYVFQMIKQFLMLILEWINFFEGVQRNPGGTKVNGQDNPQGPDMRWSMHLKWPGNEVETSTRGV